jgi:hypothetical protein
VDLDQCLDVLACFMAMKADDEKLITVRESKKNPK